MRPRACWGDADGSLPELDRLAFTDHLSACPACRSLAEDYLVVIRLANTLPPVRPSRGTKARPVAALAAAV